MVKNSEAVGLLLVNFSRSGQVHCEVALASWQRCLAKSKHWHRWMWIRTMVFLGSGKNDVKVEGPRNRRIHEKVDVLVTV